MDPNREQVDRTLSLIAALDLPHPSGTLLESFVTEALHPVAAARYVMDRLSTGDARSLVLDWIYIVESGKARRSSAAELEFDNPGWQRPHTAAPRHHQLPKSSARS